MNMEEIITSLKAERARIDKVLAALDEKPKRHRKPMSKAARAKIAAAQKARWAKQKKG